MTESTSFLLANDKEEKEKKLFCYPAAKAGEAEASQIVRIKNLHDTIKPRGLITPALSKETELGMNKDFGIEKVNIENKGCAAGALGSLTTAAGRDHRVDAACVCPVFVRALADPVWR